jgi:ribA/ribD-fused uncharacterized protein
MEGIETLALFEEKVSVTPRDLANPKLNIHSVILTKLAEKLEGRCSLHGWVVPHSMKILSRSMGYLEPGRFTGDVVFHIQAQGKVLNPPSGSRLVCDVIGNNKMGLYVSYKRNMKSINKKTKQTLTQDMDAIKIILPRDLHFGNEEFSKIQVGDKVHVEVKKSRFQVNDAFILSVGVFEGKVGSDYVAPEVEEEENVQVEEQGPGRAAAEATQRFEEQVSKEEKKEGDEEELQFTIEDDEMPPLINAEGRVVQETGPSQSYRSAGTLVAGIPYASGEPIYFNATKLDAYKELDPRFPATFTEDGKEWPSVEHYYQAMKFPTSPEYQEQIRKAPTALAAQKLGKSKDPRYPIRADWKEQRETILRRGIVAKFDQNRALYDLLMKTYPSPLIFADANDAFWGYGRTKMGQNRLGRILMDYRNTHTGMEALN